MQTRISIIRKSASLEDIEQVANRWVGAGARVVSLWAEGAGDEDGLSDWVLVIEQERDDALFRLEVADNKVVVRSAEDMIVVRFTPCSGTPMRFVFELDNQDEAIAFAKNILYRAHNEKEV